MNIKQLETTSAGYVVDGICETLSQSGRPFYETFAAFLAKYGSVVDNILITRHGSKLVKEDQLEFLGQRPTYLYTIEAYLMERAPWIRQQLAYVDADYDPIENFVAHEEETIEDDIKLRDKKLTHTDHPYTFQHTKQTPQTITEQYTEADIVTETGQTKTTVDNSVTSYDSDVAHENTKSETTPGKITNTEKPYNRKFKTPQITVTDTDTLQASRIYDDQTIEQPHKDKHTRELDRHGNQGIQTAAQMMQLDSDWWKDNRWLSALALDIVNLICERVEAI